MTDYRAVVRHVRYWRGQIHHWSTSYSFTGSGTTLDTAAAETLLLADDAMCYSGTSEAVQGTTYECEIYLAGGGTPVASYRRLDPSAPSAWIKMAATGWTSSAVSTDPSAEVALLVTFNGGLGRTGKPVTFRKWFHAVPQAQTAPPAADVTAAHVTSLTAQALLLRTCLSAGYGLVMGNAGRLGTDITVEPYYGNHQMPRGRRRLSGASGEASSYRGKTIVAPLPVQED